jgi:hypothetical protein
LNSPRDERFIRKELYIFDHRLLSEKPDDFAAAVAALSS